MKKLIIIALVILNISAFSKTNNPELIIKGITTDGMFEYSKGLHNVAINIYEYNNLIGVYNCNENGEFEFPIPTNSYITIEFKKNGFISKRILVDTESNPDIKKKGSFDFEVSLLKDEDGIEIGDMDFPMAVIRYNNDQKSFTLTNRTFTLVTQKNDEMLNEKIVTTPLKNGKLVLQ